MMENVWLIVCVAAVMSVGYFAVKRLDVFLATNTRAAAHDLHTEADTLRIAFSTPLTVECVSWALERLSKDHPAMGVSLYTGDMESVARQLWYERIDVAFVTQNIRSHLPVSYEMAAVGLRKSSAAAKKPEWASAPSDGDTTPQYMIWRKSAYKGAADEFASQLLADLRVQSGSAGRNVL